MLSAHIHPLTILEAWEQNLVASCIVHTCVVGMPIDHSTAERSGSNQTASPFCPCRRTRRIPSTSRRVSPCIGAAKWREPFSTWPNNRSVVRAMAFISTFRARRVVRPIAKLLCPASVGLRIHAVNQAWHARTPPTLVGKQHLTISIRTVFPTIQWAFLLNTAQPSKAPAALGPPAKAFASLVLKELEELNGHRS